LIPAFFNVLLFVFWIEQTFRFKPIDIKGLSTINLVYLAMAATWILALILQRRMPRISSLHKYCMVLILIVLCAIPQKQILGEIRDIRVMQDVLIFKKWVEPFFAFFVFYDLIDRKEACRTALWGLIFLLLASVLVTLLVASEVFIIGEIQWERGGPWPKFAEPNEYGSFLVLMIPVLLSHILVEKKFWLKMVTGGFAVLTFAAVVSTGSRGCFLSSIVAVGFYTFYLYRRKIVSGGMVVLGVGVIMLTVVAGFFLAPDRLKEETTNRVEYGETQTLDDYSSGRLTIWANAWEQFMRNPFIGHGLDSFPQLNLQIYGMKFSAHNEYLTYLVDHGGLGLLAYLAVQASIFFHVSGHLGRTRDPFGQLLLLSFLCGFVGISMAKVTVKIYNLRLAFWLYTAVVYAYIRIDSQKAGASDDVSGTLSPKNSFAGVES
jgi:O-antigen ligase